MLQYDLKRADWSYQNLLRKPKNLYILGYRNIYESFPHWERGYLFRTGCREIWKICGCVGWQSLQSILLQSTAPKTTLLVDVVTSVSSSSCQTFTHARTWPVGWNANGLGMLFRIPFVLNIKQFHSEKLGPTRFGSIAAWIRSTGWDSGFESRVGFSCPAGPMDTA